MLFLFNLFNHNELGIRSLEDVIAILIHQLRAIGHQAEFFDQKKLKLPPGQNVAFVALPNVVNVLIEGFTSGNDIDELTNVMTHCRRQGAKFLIIGTEQPTEKGFNHGLERPMVERQKAFPNVAKCADAIWALVPGSAKWFSQFAPAVDVELGYAPTLVRRSNVVVDHEFGFFGRMTKRRKRILTNLARRVMYFNKNQIKIQNFTEQNKRDYEMSRAKVIVQVRAEEKMGLVSSSRCNTALHIGRPVIAEPHELSAPWDQVVHFSKTTDAFYDDCVSLRGIYQGLHQQQFEKFKTLFSPDRCVGNAIRATGLEKRKAA